MSVLLVLGLLVSDARMSSSSMDTRLPSSRLEIESEDEYDRGFHCNRSIANNRDR